MTVVLSSHFVRYALLPHSPVLKPGRDWLAYAQHAFASIYGGDAARWQIRLCQTGAREPRIACAVDAELLEPLRAMPRLESIQPYLMAAFNARRQALRAASAWLVLHEPRRLTLGLIEKGMWRAIRVRQCGEDWRNSLADILDRETAVAGAPQCNQAALCSEEEAPAQIGRYRILDLSLPRGASADLRPHVMTLH